MPLPAPKPVGNLLAFARPPLGEHGFASLLDALRAEEARHAAAKAAIIAQIEAAFAGAGAPVRVPAQERRDTKKAAAAALKMSETRLMRLIGEHHVRHPDRPRLAVQPAGSKHKRWTVYTDRVRVVIESGTPY